MNLTALVIGSVALVLAIATLAYSVKLAVIYHRFNEQIEDWSQSLYNKMLFSVDSAARDLLRQLDERISEENSNKGINKESDEE